MEHKHRLLSDPWFRRLNIIILCRTEDRALSRKEILESVKDSLENLQLEYIDLVIIHKNDSHCPLEGMHLKG